MILKLKIDVTKVDKDILFKGKKGVYLDATVLIKDEEDQYGNHGMIVQDVSKESRDAGNRGAILGNAKWAEGKGPSPAKKEGWDEFDAAHEKKDEKRREAAQAVADANDEEEDIPF